MKTTFTTNEELGRKFESIFDVTEMRMKIEVGVRTGTEYQTAVLMTRLEFTAYVG